MKKKSNLCYQNVQDALVDLYLNIKIRKGEEVYLKIILVGKSY